MKFPHFLLILYSLTLLFSPVNAAAQDETTAGPVYIVQPGDTLWGISKVFDVSVEALASTNGIVDASLLSAGARLVIPGYEGLEGVLVIDQVPYGESLRSLSRRYQVPFEVMARLNHITSPDTLAAGADLITIEKETAEEEAGMLTGGRAALHGGQSLLELAITKNTSPWTLVAENGLQGTWDALPGDVIHISGSPDTGPGALPETIAAIEINPFPAVQGKTLVYRVHSSQILSLEGSIGEWELSFFPDGEGAVALQGIHAMLEQGYYPSVLKGELADGTVFEFSQLMYVQDGFYPFDPPLVVDSETVDVENTQPEDFEWFSIVAPVTLDRRWDGTFSAPVPDELKNCYPSLFGNRRSYNGSAYNFFHTGLDFCGRTGVAIRAPAPGEVVFTEELIVRGNSTVIDHGWGVYTAYAHQSEIQVSVGDQVETGQVIGLVGETGRVTGPHLHWEVIVGGVQVDPLDWLARTYP